MAVFNGSVNDIESKKNKTSSISATPSDEKYPSEKAVKDYVDNNSGGGGISEEVVDEKIYAALEEWGRQIEPESQRHKVSDIDGVDEGDVEFCYPNVLAVINYVAEKFNESQEQINMLSNDVSQLWHNAERTELKLNEVEGQIGDIETALDSIIAIQEELLGIIVFLIDDVSYTALNGMTWEEWCNSEHNTGDFNYDVEVDGNGYRYVWDNSGRLVSTITSDGGEPIFSAVSPTDKIISGYAYTY